MLVNKSIDRAYGLGCTISMINASTLKIMSYHVVSFLRKLVFQLSRVYVNWGDGKLYEHQPFHRILEIQWDMFYLFKIMPWSVSEIRGKNVPEITMPTIEMMIFCDLGIPSMSDQLILASFDLGVENMAERLEMNMANIHRNGKKEGFLHDDFDLIFDSNGSKIFRSFPIHDSALNKNSMVEHHGTTNHDGH